MKRKGREGDGSKFPTIFEIDQSNVAFKFVNKEAGNRFFPPFPSILLEPLISEFYRTV